MTLTDDVGVLQHATENVPNRSEGYCTDDVARALIVAIARLRLVPGGESAGTLASTYLAFLEHAQREDGRFRNFMSYDRHWLEDVGSQDSNARALWGLGYAMRYAPDERWRRVAQRLFRRGASACDWLNHPLSEAYATLGLAHAVAVHAGYLPVLRLLAQRLLERLAANTEPGWTWFAQAMTYDVGRLPEAVVRAGIALKDELLIEGGRKALAFYEGVAFEGRIFVPIGNRGWYERGGARARYDQQPLEAAAMVGAELAVFEATGSTEARAAARAAMAWYEGANSEGIVMEHGGGCYDGLGAGCANRNMGAESTLSLLSAAYALSVRQRSSIAIAR